MINSMPVLFVSHGAPTLLLDGTRAEVFFRKVSNTFPKPKGILVVSAHWEAKEFTVSVSKKQHAIYDFYGFPKELYEYKYEPKGAVELAGRVKHLLEEGGVKVLEAERGLDHGAWVPLICMYPDADVPVTQVSLKKNVSGSDLIKVGTLIKNLRTEGYLILASGSSTHNLSDFGRHEVSSEPLEYALLFDKWLEEKAKINDVSALVNYRQGAPWANRNHPTDDHFSPFLVAAGAGDSPAVKIHDEFIQGFLSLSAFRWG